MATSEITEFVQKVIDAMDLDLPNPDYREVGGRGGGT